MLIFVWVKVRIGIRTPNPALFAIIAFFWTICLLSILPRSKGCKAWVKVSCVQAVISQPFFHTSSGLGYFLSKISCTTSQYVFCHLFWAETSVPKCDLTFSILYHVSPSQSASRLSTGAAFRTRTFPQSMAHGQWLNTNPLAYLTNNTYNVCKV
jgi:hypothetical protein